MNPVCLEICVDSIESAINAAAGGADRLELCSALCVGGLTPTTTLLCEVKRNVDLPIFCMIRPREGPSIYSDKEKELMVAEVKVLKESGADGFVFGALLEDGSVDKQFCEILIKIIGGLPCTFHRAFDQIANPLKDIEVLIDIGFHRVLTSGSKSSAIEGSSLIKELNKATKGRIIILAGAGVRSSNCLQLVRETGVKEIHSSSKCKRLFPELFSHEVQLGTQEDANFIYFTSTEEVKLTKMELSKL